ncbi:MAG TPA: tRNA (N6-threonylcarbamoyladenosine(37)-N6)-methyltransferase TrmO [Polyangiaceae bacterium]|nr:tRNA (N6-threonylcarbamoyladenosine(37)-N6)-methyltransferase TrmO [Polyangiaceae bacterium]
MIRLEPIGIAHTPFLPSVRVPRQGGAPASIELFPHFVSGLDGLLADSHLWVFGWFEGAARTTHARGRSMPDGAPTRGVFAMRSPARPNPIALTAARLLRIDGNVLHLDRLDFRDGTPVLDIKPYSPGWDLIPCALSAHRYDPNRYDQEELRIAIARDAVNAVGPDALEDPLIRNTAEGLARLIIETRVDPRDPHVSFEVGHLDGRVEVLLCVAGSSFGNRRLRCVPLPPDVLVAVVDDRGPRWEIVETLGRVALRASQSLGASSST